MSGLVLSVYNAVSELPSGAANGTMAWIAGSTNRLYISNGTAWYSTSAFANVALSTYTLAGDYHHTLLSKAELNDANNTWTFRSDYISGISIDPNDNSIIIPGMEEHWTPSATYRPAIWKLNNPSSGLPSLSWSSILTTNAGNDPMSDSDTDADGNIYYVYWGRTSGGDYGGIFAKVSPTGSLIWESLVYDSAYAVSTADSKMLVETIQIDKENNIAVIGCRDNDLKSSFIQKWDISQSTPSIIWSRKLLYGTSLYNGQFHRAVIDNNGNIYTSGISAKREQDLGVPNPRQDVFVTKHSSDGTLQWQKHYCTSETPTIAVRGFATDSENNLILGGYGYTYDNGSQSDRDWILKLDTDGNILWQRHIGQDTDGTTTVDNTTRLGSVRNILVDADDFIIAAGGSNRIGFFDPYGELIRSLEFSPSIGTDCGMILDNNNNLVVVSSTSVQQGADYLSSAGIYVLPSNSQLIETGTYNDTGNSLGVDVIISEYNDLVIYSNGADFEINNGIATVTSVTTSTTTSGTTRASGSGYQVYNTALPPYGPVITSITDASAGTSPFTLATDGTPTVITVTATDTDNDPLTYSYSVSSGTLGDTATISQADNVFTITPSTSEANAGTFGLTFSVNDGDQTTTSVAEFTLSFVDPWYGDRALFAGGTGASSATSNIDYFSISTVGSVTKFGDLSTRRYYMASSGLSDSNYCLFLGGSDIDVGLRVDTIDYVTSSIPSASTTDFGNLSSGSMDGTSGVCDATYGLHLTGYLHPNYINTIDYFTIASPSNATDFGDATDTQHSRGGGTNDSTRGVFIGGYGTAGAGTTDYVTIATPANAQNFGNLINNNYDCSACSNNVLGVVGGGYDSSTFAQLSALDYITIQTLGNTTNAGDLTVSRHKISACSNGSIGVWAGGNDSSPYNTIDYVTLSTTGNATDYGDLTVGGYGGQATSGAPA